MKVQPIGDKVVIKKHEAPQQTAGGILLAASKGEKNTLATVVAVGNGTYNENGVLIPLTVKVGDTVLIMTTSGVPMKVDNDEHHVIIEKEILAIVEQE
jgi:chaperonin GroES